MQKALLLFCLSFLFTSCETLEKLKAELSSLPPVEENTGYSKPEQKKIRQPWYSKDKIDKTVWDLSVLDTARNSDYMYEIEKNIILEMNMARSNPKKYAEMYIEPRIKWFNGKVYNDLIVTKEGTAVVSECVKFMNSQKSLPLLTPSKGLTQAAKDHVSTQSLTDQTGHTGTDGSDPFDRMKRYGTYTTAGENIAYGQSSAREIVVDLLIDDGVKSRGHRKNIMYRDFTAAGVGYADRHQTYGYECVIDFAGNYTEKQTN